MRDIFIIGGGINGVGIAADAAGRGLSVTLCEKQDFASGTSSASTKLIHGGLRYLEYFEFALVRAALQERNRLLTLAPHLISPLQIVMPYAPMDRSRFKIRMGLWLYDHLSRHQTLPHAHFEKNLSPQFANSLKKNLQQGFVFFDAWTDDSRLVIANALRAKENSAQLLLQTEFVRAKRFDTHWEIVIRDQSQRESVIAAKCLINASGPYVTSVANKIDESPRYELSLVKGSHIIVPKLYQGDHAYLLQHNDRRVIFVIPYQNDFSLIGTTDIPHQGEACSVKASEDEKIYLCDAVNRYFQTAINPQQITHSYAGLRPLIHGEKDPQALSRDYKIAFANERAPLVTILGGKLTTYRRLANDVMTTIAKQFPNMKNEWTDSLPLPGNNFPRNDAEYFSKQMRQRYNNIEPLLLTRYLKTYGTRIEQLLPNNQIDLGEHFGEGLYEQEVLFLIEEEWAHHVEDIVWRRTKLGLRMRPQELARLEAFMRQHVSK